MTKVCFLDFETRSRCNLPAAGDYNYARDASTEVLCMSYAFDGGEVQTWRPGDTFPAIGDAQIRAHGSPLGYNARSASACRAAPHISRQLTASGCLEGAL